MRVITRTSRTDKLSLRRQRGRGAFQHGCNGPGREGQDEDAVMRLGAETAPERVGVGSYDHDHEDRLRDEGLPFALPVTMNSPAGKGWWPRPGPDGVTGW